MSHEGRQQVILVTGATSGIGAAVAQRFSAAGARVIAAGRRTQRLETLAHECGPDCLPLALDVRDEAGVKRALAGLPAAFAPITVLVNNAGSGVGGALAQASSLENWNEIVQTNINGLLFVTHAVLPGMVERDYGDIVNLGSIGAREAYPTSNVYGASKAFVQQFSQALRSDLLGCNIRVLYVQLGTTETEFALVRTGSVAKARELYNRPNLLQPADVAEAVFLSLALPRRANVACLELMPISQAAGALRFADDMAPLEDPAPSSRR